MAFTEQEILEELDFAWKGIPSGSFPPKEKEYDIQYNFFLDLEHGYCDTAGSRIHLYADESNWAIVFEKSGYFNRGYCADIELDYVGNCIRYDSEWLSGNIYTTNSIRIPLITAADYGLVANTTGNGLETFELISSEATTITVHGEQVEIEQNISEYQSLNIPVRDFENPRNLIGFDSIVRYFSETNSFLVSATEHEIKQGFLYDIPKLMALDEFHFTSVYDEEKPPSQQELYQQIAKVLITKHIFYWRPSLPPNNHWSNWESGHL